MTTSASTSPFDLGSYQRAQLKEKLENAQHLNLIRFAGVSVLFGLNAFLGFALHLESWRGNLGVFGAYWGFATAMFFSARFSLRAARLASLSVPFVDMPMTFFVQLSAFATSTSVRGIAGFSLGLFVLLVIIAALSLERWQVVVAAIVGATLEGVLEFRAGDSAATITFSTLIIAITAFICFYAGRRRLDLAMRVAHENVRRERLGRYFSPAVADYIDQHGENFAAGQNSEVTVLFCDIRDFTALSRDLPSSKVVELLNEFHAVMVGCVFAHGGTLDKYTGDGLMAYFGAPVAQSDHAERAVRCALTMYVRLDELNAGRLARRDSSLRMGVGIHTGRATIGSIGAPHRREFTAIGDTVNLASRLESLTKTEGEEILVSDETCRQIGGTLAFKRLSAAIVKGHVKPIQIFAPLPPGGVSGEKRLQGRADYP